MPAELEREQILAQIYEERRPWGTFRRFADNQECTVKIITVDAGESLSLQSHRHRDELWRLLDPGLAVEIDDEVFEPEVGEEFVIMRGQKHRLSSRGPGGRVLEVAFGFFDESDIERFDDRYGR